MNPRIRKELRPLLPMVCVTPVVAVAPSLIWPKDGDGLGTGMLLLAVCCAALGASSFGNEFHWRTMPLLLAQPISRQKLWFEKLLALGLAYFVAILLCLIALFLVFTLFGGYGAFWSTLSSFGLIFLSLVLCAICATPYLTLLSRNTVGGLVFSLVIPQFIFAAISIAQRYVLISTPGTYLIYAGCAALFYWLGYRKFMNSQVTDGIEQSVRLPRSVENAFAAPFRLVFARSSGPIASLIKKEFRIQQISFTMAALLFLAALVGFWTWRHNSNLARVPLVLAFLVMVFASPLLVGALAVVEERAWGMAEWHVTLPVSARKQWFAKMAVTFFTSLALGTVLPSLLIWLFRAITLTDSKEFELPSGFIGLPFNLLLTAIAVYAASLSTSTIRAIFLAFGLAAAIAGAVNIGGAIGANWGWFSRPTYFGVHSVLFGEISEVVEWVILFIQVYLVFYLFQRLAFSNFRRREATASRAGVQVLAVLFLIVMFVAVFSIPGYFR